ncbi:MAG: DUF1045 domain-containing protein [Paracoccus sp. (in: a-proteobacteria)]|nr:DUF1045 domain-containing protein [Paracoccus sp. (in: a-proteobacteria)]
MTPYSRFAIYYTPPEGEFSARAARWLGWDIAAGQRAEHPQIDGLDVAGITETPRKYGFHATIKAPFRLAAGAEPALLQRRLTEFAATQAPVTLEGGLTLARLGGFVAGVPASPSAALQDLAANTVRALDDLRAPLSEAEIARRRPERLSPAERANLDQWGYPYVMDAFRFHMTLSGDLADPAPVIAALEDYLGPHIPRPLTIEALTLCGEAEGRFHQIARVPLGG